MSRYYNGPVSDHFDGERFFDPHGVPPKKPARSAALDGRSLLARHQGEVAGLGAIALCRPPAGARRRRGWRISYVGHASWLIQTAGLNMLLDPVWSKRASPFRFVGPKRVNDPGIAFATCRRSMSCWCRTATTIISISPRCRGSRPRIARASSRRSATTPSCAITIPHRGRSLRLARSGDIGAGVAVTLVPTRHWSARSLSDRNMSLWASFVIEAPGGRIYFVADSGYGDGRHFRARASATDRSRLAILPIGAYEPRWFMRDQHMNPAEAVQALHRLRRELALAHHYGTFQLTDEAIDAPLVALADALASSPEFRPSDSARCGPGRCGNRNCHCPRPRTIRRLFDQDKDVDDQMVLVGGQGIGHILLDEHVLGFEPLLVEIVGDRLVGIVQSVIRAAMDEFERVAFRRGADGDVAARRIFRRLGDTDGGLN
jgi:L-ascorbate metabolism protein UlaG (beta-lactamase superfamily)